MFIEHFNLLTRFAIFVKEENTNIVGKHEVAHAGCMR